jgi:hypothetical protein
MNNERRKQLRNLSQRLGELLNILEGILSDEQISFDNMPENLQNSMRGSDSEEAISQMEEAVENLEEAIKSIDEII